MTTWRISDADAARDLRVDTDTDARNRLRDDVPASPDFTKMSGPGNRITRRIAGRNN